MKVVKLLVSLVITLIVIIILSVSFGKTPPFGSFFLLSMAFGRMPKRLNMIFQMK